MSRNRKPSVSRLALLVLMLVLSVLAAPTGAQAGGTAVTTSPETPPAGSTTCSGCSFIGPYIDPNGSGT